MLHARVPGGQGRCPQQAHRAVGRDQAAAGPRRPGTGEPEDGGRAHRGDKGQEPSHSHTSLSRRTAWCPAEGEINRGSG